MAGSILAIAAIGSVVLAIQEGPERGWTDGAVLVAFVTGFLALVGFVRTELPHQHPLLDVRYFSHRGLAAGSVNLFVVFAVMFALFLVLVQFFQAGLGYSALRAATALLPLAVLMMPLAAVAPTLAHRFGFRRTVVSGMPMLAIGLGLIAAFADVDRGYLSVLPGLVVLAVGVGLAMSPSTTAITASLPEDKQGVASALNDTVREMGGAVGVALIGSVLNAGYRHNIDASAHALPPPLAAATRSGIGGALASASQRGPVGGELVTAARDAYVRSMHFALWLAAGMALFSALYTALSMMRLRHASDEVDATAEAAPRS